MSACVHLFFFFCYPALSFSLTVILFTHIFCYRLLSLSLSPSLSPLSFFPFPSLPILSSLSLFCFSRERIMITFLSFSLSHTHTRTLLLSLSLSFFSVLAASIRFYSRILKSQSFTGNRKDIFNFEHFVDIFSVEHFAEHFHKRPLVSYNCHK